MRWNLILDCIYIWMGRNDCNPRGKWKKITVGEKEDDGERGGGGIVLPDEVEGRRLRGTWEEMSLLKRQKRDSSYASETSKRQDEMKSNHCSLFFFFFFFYILPTFPSFSYIYIFFLHSSCALHSFLSSSFIQLPRVSATPSFRSPFVRNLHGAAIWRALIL